MGLFDFLKSDPGQFVSAEAYQANLESQLSMSPQTLEQLRGHGVSEESELKLEFFFYTNTKEKAKALAEELASLGYGAKADYAAHDRQQQVITGWSTPVPMQEKALLDWTKDMCERGFNHDCEFDGWGTTPAQ